MTVNLRHCFSRTQLTSPSPLTSSTTATITASAAASSLYSVISDYNPFTLHHHHQQMKEPDKFFKISDNIDNNFNTKRLKKLSSFDFNNQQFNNNSNNFTSKSLSSSSSLSISTMFSNYNNDFNNNQNNNYNNIIYNNLSPIVNMNTVGDLPSPIASSINMVLNNDNNNDNYYEKIFINNKQFNQQQQQKLFNQRNIDYYGKFGWKQILEQPQQQQRQQKKQQNLFNSLINSSFDNLIINFNNNNSDNNNNNNNKQKQKRKQQQQQQNNYCTFCKNLPPERGIDYRSHSLKDNQKRITCPILRAYNCPKCNNGGGDYAHTLLYCPNNRLNLAKDFQQLLQRRQQKQFIINNNINNLANNFDKLLI